MKKRGQGRAENATVAVIPVQVSAVMAEIARNVQEDLPALAVGAGLQVMPAMMEPDMTALAGQKASTTRTPPPGHA